MPSVVSMPPNISTAALEMISAGLRPGWTAAASREPSAGSSMTAARLSLSWPNAAVPAATRADSGVEAPRGQLGDRADDGVVPGQDGARVDLAEPEGPGHDGHGQRCGQAAAQVAPAGGTCRAGARRCFRCASRRPGGPLPRSRTRLAWSCTPDRLNGAANGRRCRSCPGPSSESMLGPTIRAVEKRGSLTVKAALSRMTAAARSHRVTSQPFSTGTQETGSASRSRASAGWGSSRSSASVTAAPRGYWRACGSAGPVRHDLDRTESH